jgi:hypothetical protein
MQVASAGSGHGRDELDWVAAAIADVCGIDAAVIRPDTPLASIGVDRLAAYCVADALDVRLSNAGLRSYDDRAIDAASTVADLMAPLAAAFTGSDRLKDGVGS